MNGERPVPIMQIVALLLSEWRVAVAVGGEERDREKRAPISCTLIRMLYKDCY